jgi:Family of unknown function (DUF5677)
VANPETLVYDFDEHARHFAKTFAKSLVAIENLHKALLECLAASRSIDQTDRTIYLLAATCLRDFNEIKLLATRELGTGAVKLVRALYERVVTLSYLAKYPGEIQQFIDYSDVHWHKLLVEAKEVYGDDESAMSKIVSKGEADIIKQNFEKAKPNFQQTDCKKCKTARLQGSWTKKGMPQLASGVSKEVRSLYFKAFLSPTFHIHTTFWGIVDQYTKSTDGKLVFNEAHEEETARDAMDIAHTLLLQVFDVVNAHFKLDKGELLKERAQDWLQSWRETAPEGHTEKT